MPTHMGTPHPPTDPPTTHSVDMFLAVAVTSLVWRWRAPLYSPADTWQERPRGAGGDPVPRRLVALVAGVLLLVFVGVAGT